MTKPAVCQVVVSRTFEESVGPQGLRAYVDAIVGAVHAAPAEDSVGLTAELTRRFGEAGIGVNEIEVERLAERLSAATDQGLRIGTDDGRELYVEGAPDEGDPNVASPSSEPEDPERPAWS